MVNGWICQYPPISSVLIRESFQNKSLPRDITDLIVHSSKTTLRIRYTSVLSQWFIYATLWNTDPCTTSDVNTVLSFMQSVYINGCLYGGLSVAPRAVSIIVTIKDYAKFSEELFFSCIYNKHPPLPKILVSGIYLLY